MIPESSIAAGYPAPRAWRPAPLAAVSLFMHGAGATVLIAHPASWPWVIAALAANHLVLTAAVFFPRAQLLGPNLNRLSEAAASRHEVCLTFDDGPHPQTTPRLLELLERHGAKASFFCIGQKAAAHPEIVRDIVRRGHSVENHSYRHSHAFACFGVARMSREIELAQQALSSMTGRRPGFFRAPAGFRSPLLDFVLARYSLRYVSWTRRGFDAQSGDRGRVLNRLTRGLAAGDILLLHDSNPLVLQIVPALLDELAARGLRSVSLPLAF
jgi:peptidoglycan/xylan/chitin deacetylase (PgdA/CDA1 family)